MIELESQQISANTFAPFGQLIDFETAEVMSINQGMTSRLHNLFPVDTQRGGGYPLVNVFRTSPLPLPHTVKTMERHPLGSQCFIPLDGNPFLVLVADPVKLIEPQHLHLFHTTGFAGINLNPNIWHHYQIGHGTTRDFLVVDRGGPGNNLEEVSLSGNVVIPASAIENL